jgi:FkbM family methyltransferase
VASEMGNRQMFILIIFVIVVFFVVMLNRTSICDTTESNTIEKIIISNRLEEVKKLDDKSPRRENENQTIKQVDSIFSKIFSASSEQKKIDKNIIIQTARFMLEERAEDDPELIAFVRSLIMKPPTGKSLNLQNKNKVDFSQIGQSAFMDNALNYSSKGFFVEAGGHDGEWISNTLYFELKYAWTGILIEPLPYLCEKILEKNRNIYVLNACIANKRPIISKLNVADAWSGRLSEMDAETKKKYTKNSVVYVPCFSLYTILKAIEVDKIDYFSLDIEGGEYDVLKSIDFNKLNIRSFTIEHNGVKEPKKNIKNLMAENNYKLLKEDGQDFYYIKN